MAPKSSPTPKSIQPIPGILRLPLELRQLIYAHLLDKKLTSHPLPGVGFTQVSHPPPSSALLNIHPQLTDEILDYFYTISIWTLIFSHAFNFFRIDPDLRGLERSYVLKRVRKIECIVFCDVLLLKAGTSEGLDSFCAQIRRRVKRAADVLAQAEELRSVTISWLDSTTYAGEMALESKARILSPLRRLKAKPVPVRFSIGRIHGIQDEAEQKKFGSCMLEVLGEESTSNRPDERRSLDGSNDAHEPGKLRLLAFDPKQVGNLHRERLAWVARRDVITGAGVWRATNMPLQAPSS
jgi:hypothetical protein